MATNVEGNKAIARRLAEELVQGGDLALVDELFAVDYVPHDPSDPGRPGGRDGARQFIAMLHTGMSDVRYTIEDLIAEGDRVMYRWTLRGRHTGPFMGIPPTGNRIAIDGIDLFRIEAGRIAESWVAADALGMLQQLGVLPPPGPPGAAAPGPA